MAIPSNSVSTTTITNTPIPIYYRVFFIFFDLLLPIFGIVMNTLNPMQNLKTFTPNPADPPAPETLLIIDGTSGFFAMLAFLNVYLLAYRPNDIVVWKGLIAGVLFQDLFMVGGFLRELKLDGRDWRGEDYGNVVGYIFLGVVRALFVLGVGVGGKAGKGEGVGRDLKKRA